MLADLHATMERGDPGEGVEAVVLPTAFQGLGGVGKTSIAIEYAYRFSTCYDLIWWVPAADEQDIRRSMASLGRALGVPEAADLELMIDGALDALRLRLTYPRWLLVFDNATDPEVVRRYIPRDAGRVIVTSRNTAWRAVSHFIEVDVFTAEDCLEFLRRRWPELSAAGATELSEKLGRLPLALELAAAFHAETGMTLGEYMRTYDRLVVSLLSKETLPDYGKPVALTWRLSFDHVREQSKAAAQLLRLCAFLGSEPISMAMLREGRGAALQEELAELLQDELEFRTAVQLLGRFALAKIDSKRDLISVHNLVCAVLRADLTADESAQLLGSAHAVLALANPGRPDRSDTWNRHKQIAPHVLPSGCIHSDVQHVRQVAIDQVRYFFAVGDFASSRTLAERALEDWNSRLGPEDPMTLRMRFHFGNALRSLGEYELARKETQETYDVLERSLGPTHEYTLAVANSLGAGLRFIGEFSTARASDELVYERHRSALGESISTIRAANNFAVDLRLVGDFDAARKIDLANIEYCKQADPTNSDPESLLFANNLVRDLLGLGKYTEALELQQDWLGVFAPKLGAHPYLLVSRRNLSIIHRKRGDFDRALVLADAVKQAAEAVSGTEAYLAALMTFTNTLRVKLEWLSAQELCEEAHQTYRKRFGENHPFTLACAVNLAIIYRGQRLYGEARELDEGALARLRERLGRDHPYALACAANLSNDLDNAGESDAALQLSRDVYERSRTSRPVDHPNTLLAAANLVLDLQRAQQHTEADTLRAHALQQLRIILGPEHPETINVERGRRAETDIEVPQL